MMTAWARFTLGPGRLPVLLGVAVLTVVFGVVALDARLERSNESMNARPPEQRRVSERFAESFGSDETIVVAVRDDRLLDAEGIERLRGLVARIEAIDGVARVRSLLGAVEIVGGPFGAAESPLVPPGAPHDRARLERALDRNEEMLGALVGPDRRTAGIFVDVEDRPDDDAYRAHIVDRLRELKSEAARAGREIHVTGITVQKHDTTRFVARDQRVILPASVAVFAVLLVAITRRRSGVVLPLVVTAITLVWTLGALTAFGHDLNVITSLLPPVVMVLSITTSFHLYQEWLALSRIETDRRRLAIAVVSRLGAPCTLTALTTALGLASLSVSDIPAVRQFGLFAALGVVISLVLNLTLLPLAFSWLRPEKRLRQGPSPLTPLLDRAVAVTVRHPWTVVAATAVVTAVAIVGITRVRNDTDLMSFLPPEAELVRDTRWVDRELVGTDALDLLIERADGEPLADPADLRAVHALTRRIVGMEEVTTAVSIAGIVARVHQAEEGLDAPALPDDPDDLRYVYDLLADSDHERDLRQLITPDLRRARVVVRLHAIGTAAGEQVIRRIEEMAAAELGDRMSATPTGGFHAMVMDSNRLVSSQVSSFGLALATIFIALALYLRSPRLLLAALWPNLVPIVWCLGAMGWLGIDLSTATTMVASVVIGIAVDDTIHYLSRFRREHHGDVAAAVRATTHSTGRVLVLASFVLAVGFWVGALGSFRPTIWFSLLTGGTMLAALFCDLIVLPACLALVRPAPSTIAARNIAIAVVVLAMPCGQAAGGDTVERRAVVPEPGRPHGEVRVVLRGGATVVQTLIHSRSVRRVAGAIADKERVSWPEGTEGAADAQRYVDALAKVSAAVREAAPAGEDRRHSLCIEFPPKGPVTVSGAVVETGAEGLRLVETVAPRVTLDLGEGYVRRNRVLIVADAFGVDEMTAASWLESPGKQVATP